MSELLYLTSSQYKHLPMRAEAALASRSISALTTLSNVPVSFQVHYRAPRGQFALPVSVALETDLPTDAFRVDPVPVINAANPRGNSGFESSLPGLFPDILRKRPIKPEIVRTPSAWGYDLLFEKDTDALLNASGEVYSTVLYTVNPSGAAIAAGDYTLRITLTSLGNGELLAERTLTLTVRDVLLPPSDVYYTNWFHVDVLADTFGCDPYSDSFYDVFDEYVRNMTSHRQNTLLLPAFTPPLDTPIGSTRKNVQLVGITREGDGYRFDFGEMRRFVTHALQNGITYLEHCHLFSQWGAYGAPAIYLSDETRLFGFETDAASDTYVSFIRAYLSAFLSFAEEMGISEKVIFHLSDEPKEEQIDSYRRAHQTVADLLAGHLIVDAMSHPIFYREGLVGQPIVNVNEPEAFEEAGCQAFWLYYTGGTYEYPSSNRLISNTAALTRAIGVQMYRYRAVGFLHWAYNFYYDRMSAGIFSPASNPCGYKGYPGNSFLAYSDPSGRGAHVLPSLREKLMAEAIDDLRALRYLESLVGREETLALCESFLGCVTCKTVPEGETLRLLREAVERRIVCALAESRT